MDKALFRFAVFATVLLAGLQIRAQHRIENMGPLSASPARVHVQSLPSKAARSIGPIHTQLQFRFLPPPFISFDTVRRTYSPMPFILQAEAWNTSKQICSEGYVELSLPAPFLLAPSPHNAVRQKLPSLGPNDTARVQWLVTHPDTYADAGYTVRLIGVTSGSDSGFADTYIFIPRVPRTLHRLEVLCSAPDSLRYDAAADTYLDNPFLLRVTSRNRGLVDAVATTASLRLPEGVTLATAGDSLRRVCPFTLHEWTPGDTAWTATWLLRYVDTTFDVHPLHIDVTVSARTPDGLPADSVECTRSITLQPSIPRLEVVQHLTTPDSIEATPDRRALTPNPFTATFALRNASARTYDGLSIITLSTATNEGLIFDASTPAVRSVEQGFHAGDTLRVTWTIHVEPRRTRRLVWLNVVAYEKDGTPWAFCSQLLSIDAVDTTTTGLPHEGVLPRTPIFDVTPHPVTGIARITLSTAIRRGSVVVSDLLGRILFTRAMEDVQQGEVIHIDLSNRSRGIYLVQLQDDGKTHTARIIKR